MHDKCASREGRPASSLKPAFNRAKREPHERRQASKLLEDLVIFRMGADPEPHHSILLANPQGAPANTDAHGIGLVLPADFLELKTGVNGIPPPEPVAPASIPLNPLG
jgi:hypothetical protein